MPRRARPGCSPRKSHAAIGTNTTCVLPRTVASPAPTSWMAWCQSTRSTAKKIARDPRQARLARGPRAVSALLHQRDEEERGQGVGAAEDGGRRRRDVGEADVKIAEKAIVSAPSTAVRTGRSRSRATREVTAEA